MPELTLSPSHSQGSMNSATGNQLVVYRYWVREVWLVCRRVCFCVMAASESAAAICFVCVFLLHIASLTQLGRQLCQIKHITSLEDL
jgi:hypothetical protein